MSRFVIGLSVGLLVLAFVGTIALNQFFSVSTASWDAQTILIWTVIPVIFLLAILLWMLNKATDQS